MGRACRVSVPFSASEAPAEGSLGDNRHPQLQDFLGGETAIDDSETTSFSSVIGISAGTAALNFSVKLTFDAVVEGADELEADVMIEGV